MPERAWLPDLWAVSSAGGRPAKWRTSIEIPSPEPRRQSRRGESSRASLAPPRLTPLPLAQALLHRVAAQLAQGVRGDPMRGARIELADALPGGDGCAVQHQAALADLPQRPIHRLADEIALVLCMTADDRQKLEELGIRSGFIVDGQIGHHRESGAFDELFPPAAPLQGFF